MRRIVDVTMVTSIEVEVKDDHHKSDAEIVTLAEEMATAHMKDIGWTMTSEIQGEC